MLQPLIKRISETDYISEAIRDRADLSAFKKRPSARIISGVSAIILSYIVGWPMVSVLGALSLYVREPLIFVIGGPVTYGLSHLIFILGMYLAGYEYTKIFLRWAARAGVEKMMNGKG